MNTIYWTEDERIIQHEIDDEKAEWAYHEAKLAWGDSWDDEPEIEGEDLCGVPNNMPL